jgi:hypothetical protein
MASQNVHFPYPSNGRTLTSFEWRPIRYRNVISILKNLFYAGVYTYGKSEKRTTIVGVMLVLDQGQLADPPIGLAQAHPELLG